MVAGGSGGHGTMNVWIETHHELPTKGSIGFFIALGAPGQIFIDGSPKGTLQFFDARPLEVDDVFYPNHLAVKDMVVRIEFHDSCIALVFHHGVTPALIKNCFMSRTA